MNGKDEWAQVEVEMDEALAQQLSKVAQKLGCSVDELVTRCLEKYLKEKGFHNP